MVDNIVADDALASVVEPYIVSASVVTTCRAGGTKGCVFDYLRCCWDAHGGGKLTSVVVSFVVVTPVGAELVSCSYTVDASPGICTCFHPTGKALDYLEEVTGLLIGWGADLPQAGEVCADVEREGVFRPQIGLYFKSIWPDVAHPLVSMHPAEIRGINPWDFGVHARVQI